MMTISTYKPLLGIDYNQMSHHRSLYNDPPNAKIDAIPIIFYKSMYNEWVIGKKQFVKVLLHRQYIWSKLKENILMKWKIIELINNCPFFSINSKISSYTLQLGDYSNFIEFQFRCCILTLRRCMVCSHHNDRYSNYYHNITSSLHSSLKTKYN